MRIVTDIITILNEVKELAQIRFFAALGMTKRRLKPLGFIGVANDSAPKGYFSVMDKTTTVEQKKESIDKYLDSGSRKYSLYLFLLFLAPFFPDDALCFIAGLTGISYKTFILIVIIARPPGMAFSSFSVPGHSQSPGGDGL